MSVRGEGESKFKTKGDERKKQLKHLPREQVSLRRAQQRAFGGQVCEYEGTGEGKFSTKGKESVISIHHLSSYLYSGEFKKSPKICINGQVCELNLRGDR